MKEFCKVCYTQFEKKGHSQIYCSKECAQNAKRQNEKERHYKNGQTKKTMKGRYSGRSYTNSEEKLNAIKNKYKNGVTMDILNDWLGG